MSQMKLIHLLNSSKGNFFVYCVNIDISGISACRLIRHNKAGINIFRIDLYISSGCVANRTTVNQGYVSAFSGCVVNNTTINSGGGLYLSGYASATTVCSGGSMTLYYGSADSVDRSKGCRTLIRPRSISDGMVSYGSGSSAGV